MANRKTHRKRFTNRKKELAKHYLSNVSYYRLGEYWYVLQADKEKHTFKEEVTFEKVINLYEFDRELKILLLNLFKLFLRDLEINPNKSILIQVISRK